MGSTWNEELFSKIGEALGDEATQNAEVLDARARFANSETERFGNNGVALPRDALKAMDREPGELMRQSYRILSDMSAVSTPVNIGKSLHEFMRISDSGEAQGESTFHCVCSA